ncbi:unnamed protein product [Anisakis simplex]|uniref:PPM-type phosphatase domain-containing protein n=1 Tax=Anisakis simplex TaxID=6269 RepID=A0A0M3J4H8_ANISI|nr:unnamed protein product [Anisakis simplex]
MMTLNAISLYDDLGDSESSSATKPSPKTDGEKSEPDAEASNRKRLRSEEGDKNSQGDEKDTIKSKAGNAADKQTENNSGVGTVSLLSVCGWRKGEREEMQDAHVLEDHYDIITGDIKACALYGIFDGHAGKRAAQFSSQRMPTILKDKLSACVYFSSFKHINFSLFSFLVSNITIYIKNTVTIY